jgi:hypothetical protein
MFAAGIAPGHIIFSAQSMPIWQNDELGFLQTYLSPPTSALETVSFGENRRKRAPEPQARASARATLFHRTFSGFHISVLHKRQKNLH